MKFLLSGPSRSSNIHIGSLSFSLPLSHSLKNSTLNFLVT